MNTKLRICLSSFDSKKKALLSSVLVNVGKSNIFIEENLTHQTNILVSGSVDSEKFRTAKLLGIPIVRENWVLKSSEIGKLAEYNEFLLPGFFGSKISILGFSAEEVATFKSLIEDNGEGLLYTSIENTTKISKKLSCVVVKTSQLTFYNSFIDTLQAQGIKIVSENWLKICLKYKYFISVSRFIRGAPHAEICRESFKKQYEAQDIDILLEEPFHENLLFRNCAFYISTDETEYLPIKKLISLGGGLVLPDYIPIVSYVIAFEVTLDDYANFSFSQLVSPIWLCDCFSFKILIPGDEYPVDIKKPKYFPVNFGEAFKSDNSLNGKLLFRNSNAEPTKSDLKSGEQKIEKYFGKSKICSSSPIKSKIPQKSKLKQLKLCSYLFQSMWFYISHVKLNGYKYLIQEHSGRILKSISDYDPNRKLIMVHIDGQSTISLINEYSKFPNITHLSFRWVNYCISSKRVINDPQSLKMIDLLPFPHETPYSDFNGKYCYVTGFKLADNETIKKILQTLGAKVEFNLEKLEYLVCETTDNSKYRKALEKGNIKIMKEIWVFKCISSGKMILDKDLEFTN